MPDSKCVQQRVLRYTFKVRNRLFRLFLIVCVACQCVGAVNAVTFDLATGAEHEVLHSWALGHHHHDDGSLHVDCSDNSIHHTHADDGANSSWLLAPEVRPVVRHQPPMPQVATMAFAAKPYLEGLLRPPTAIAA